MKSFLLFAVLAVCLGTAHSRSSDLSLRNTAESTNKTQFMDLNQDCLLIIFENLVIKDLNSVGRTNKYFSNLVEKERGQKFLKKMLVFNELRSELRWGDHLKEEDEYFKVGRSETAARILRKFGQSIRTLKIDTSVIESGPGGAITRSVFELIRTQCVDTLTELRLKNVGQYFIDHMTVPFKNVHTVHLEERIGSLDNPQLNFNQMFPSLRDLYLDQVWGLTNASALEFRYPHLEHLHVRIKERFFHDVEYVNEGYIERIITMNPQIRSISLEETNSGLVDFVSGNLPNLEKLTLTYCKRHSVGIHFENVKSFTMKTRNGNDQSYGITFGKNLEEFQAEDDRYAHFGSYINLILDNPNLKKIRIYGSFTTRDIERLAAANLNVVEMSMYCNKYNKESLVRLIQNCKHLERLHWDCEWTQKKEYKYIRTEFKAALKPLLQNEWTLNKYGEHDYIMTKKRTIQN